ncbi:MAG: carbohydrate ABC transporter permease [Trueperaceae bacterium]
MTAVGRFLTRRQNDGRKGARRWTVADVLTYGYLIAGVLVMFGPVAWLVLSSFKTQANLLEFPPTLLPLAQQTAEVDGYPNPLPLFDVAFEDGGVARLAQVRRVGLQAQMVDPADPGEIVRVAIDQRTPVRVFRLATENYTEAFSRFNFATYLRNSVVVTVGATLITLIINSMAAFALSKYRFRGRNAIFLVIIATLMIPISVILVPVYLVITQVGWINSLWGVIIPGAATPTGVFLLRQYMLTIPDELLDSGRIDGASEWRIYWQIVLPLAAPALAVLAIFSVMWRWNDFLWPLIVLTRSEFFTLQVGLNAFQGELNVQWHYVLAMTVLTLLPITVVFSLLQRFITTGIASTGVKG